MHSIKTFKNISHFQEEKNFKWGYAGTYMDGENPPNVDGSRPGCGFRLTIFYTSKKPLFELKR